MIFLTNENITDILADIIVNSANPSLGGIGPDLPDGVGGVDGAIHRAAGIQLYQACMNITPIPSDKPYVVRCPEGEYRITAGFNLKSRLVMHAVAPMNNDLDASDMEDVLLKLDKLYKNIFNYYALSSARSLVMPPLGTRSFGLPINESAKIAIDNAQICIKKSPQKDIIFTVIRDDERNIYKKLLNFS
ncbi:MAG: hypothetical protein DI626_05370 [Micavibrio aeruginosavorus]|uniref:Macro domain-containing protein n=1 Tax=Micavibrio aeruginosavorus TaxID=349221 RepID=A0A2W4ZZQ7_9BACT|nr:MAG: hypothetical protein DI626_05370 [Micavibrio aeruginosavorus]